MANMGKGSSLSKAMKAVGRNMARANLQKSSGKGFNAGGSVPSVKSMGSMAGGGMDGTGFGSGKARGGKASKGMNFRGSI